MANIDDDEPDDIHYHVCQACGYIWCHDRRLITNRFHEHLCGKCNCGPYYEGVNTRREADELEKIWQESLEKERERI
jgi:hypothetical protein